MQVEGGATPTVLEQQLATELTRVVIAVQAPEELAVLDDVAAEYFADPAASLAAGERDEPLGFGGEFVLLGPYLLALAVPIVQYLGSLLADGAKEAVTPLIANRIRRLFRVGEPPVTADVALTSAQLQRIHTETLQRAHSAGLPPDKAAMLADSLVGGLIVDR
ncbi:MAG: hypothetical protein L0H84_12390 [Pseudonocardia sp.]|nr:hypothetical protein [Pseudonocardia sp.]